MVWEDMGMVAPAVSLAKEGGAVTVITCMLLLLLLMLGSRGLFRVSDAASF
jgi:hypothetical protein